MFAVPGWSVSAKNLKLEKISSEPSSKKRKRAANDDGLAVDANRIDELLNKQIDTDTNGVGKSVKSKKERKKLRKEAEESNGKAESAQRSNASSEVDVQVNNLVKKQQGNDVDTKPVEKVSKRPLNKDVGQDDATTQDVKRKKKKSKADKDVQDSPSKDVQQPIRSSTGTSTTLVQAPPTLTPLQAKMRQKLVSSRFRHLNETLYTNPSEYSLDLFNTNPAFFTEYHEGFRRQVEAWPEDPKDSFLRWLKERGPVGMHNYKAIRRKTSRKQIINARADGEDAPSGPESLPRDPHKGVCTIADLGCGDGKLASDITTSSLHKKLKLKVSSFDLASSAPHITVADMKSLPLEDSSIDIAIFCLALMGTNWVDFVEEAYRVLRWKGECWIAEVASRFIPAKSKRVEHSVGNRNKLKQKVKGKSAPETEGEGDFLDDDDENSSRNNTDVSAFVEVLQRRGFQLQGQPHTGNKMFVLMRFVKALPPRRGKCVRQDRREGKKKFIEEDDVDITPEEEGKVLKPCVYKLR